MTHLKSLLERRGAQVLDTKSMKHLKGGGKGSNTNGGGGMPPNPGDD